MMIKWLHGALIAVLAVSTCGAQPLPSTLTAPEAKARAIFERVIAFKTSVGLAQVPAMAAYLAGEFRAAGFRSTLGDHWL